MDYQFSIDTLNRPRAQFAIEQEAFGDWFSEEVKRDNALIERLLTEIERLHSHRGFDFELDGIEYRLTLTRQEATLTCLIESDDEFELDLVDSDELTEGDRNCGCGLDDFRQALVDWQDFIQNH